MRIKRLIDPRRMRKALPRGFGWIDHRLLRDGYISHCSPQGLALYVLLVCRCAGFKLLLGSAHRAVAGSGAGSAVSGSPGTDRPGTDRLPKTLLAAPERGTR